jgi:hypothetical protein
MIVDGRQTHDRASPGREPDPRARPETPDAEGYLRLTPRGPASTRPVYGCIGMGQAPRPVDQPAHRPAQFPAARNPRDKVPPCSPETAAASAHRSDHRSWGPRDGLPATSRRAQVRGTPPCPRSHRGWAPHDAGEGSEHRAAARPERLPETIMGPVLLKMGTTSQPTRPSRPAPRCCRCAATSRRSAGPPGSTSVPHRGALREAAPAGVGGENYGQGSAASTRRSLLPRVARGHRKGFAAPRRTRQLGVLPIAP